MARYLPSHHSFFYNVDEEHQRAFGNLTIAFDRLAECSAKWHVQASQSALPAIQAATVGAPAGRPALPAAAPSPSRNDTPLTWAEVHELQTRLKSLGFDPGAIHGTAGPATAAAVRRFETARSLSEVGNIDRQTFERVCAATP